MPRAENRKKSKSTIAKPVTRNDIFAGLRKEFPALNVSKLAEALSTDRANLYRYLPPL